MEGLSGREMPSFQAMLFPREKVSAENTDAKPQTDRHEQNHCSARKNRSIRQKRSCLGLFALSSYRYPRLHQDAIGADRLGDIFDLLFAEYS